MPIYQRTNQTLFKVVIFETFFVYTLNIAI